LERDGVDDGLELERDGAGAGPVLERDGVELPGLHAAMATARTAADNRSFSFIKGLSE
jgi:hypothetical protein